MQHCSCSLIFVGGLRDLFKQYNKYVNKEASTEAKKCEGITFICCSHIESWSVAVRTASECSAALGGLTLAPHNSQKVNEESLAIRVWLWSPNNLLFEEYASFRKLISVCFCKCSHIDHWPAQNGLRNDSQETRNWTRGKGEDN